MNARTRRGSRGFLPPIGHRSQGLPRSLETLGLLAAIGQPHPRREAGLTASHEYRHGCSQARLSVTRSF